MNSKDFVEHINKRIEACTALLGIKADEYATDDRLHNFKVAAEIQNCTPITALDRVAKHYNLSAPATVDMLIAKETRLVDKQRKEDEGK